MEQDERRGHLGEAELSRLKKQHGKVYAIEIDDDGEQYVAYFKRPDMSTLSAMTKMAKTDEIQASRIPIENTFVGGAEEVKTDSSLFLATAAQMSKVVGSARATIKNA